MEFDAHGMLKVTPKEDAMQAEKRRDTKARDEI